MSHYIISERWQVTLDPGAFVQPAPTSSPTADYSVDKLDASGLVKLGTVAGVVPNALEVQDTALIKRVRLWSPLQAVGLTGATTTADHELTLCATRRGPLAAQEGAVVRIAGPLNLGEWVDVNQTLDAKGLPAAGGAWTLGVSMPFPILLDSSRMLAGLVGAGATSLLNFVFQVEIAHSLPGIHQ